jgi:outer membrane murein-binding lipoprotein Lpp
MSRQQRFATRNQNGVDFRNKSTKLGPISNTVTLIVLACLLGLLYLTQVTKTNAYGYQLDALNQQQAQLKSDHDSLAVEAARLQSLDTAHASAQATAMAPVAPSGTVQN